MLRQRKKRLAISLSVGDYLCAKSHRFVFLRCFSDFLKGSRDDVPAGDQ